MVYGPDQMGLQLADENAAGPISKAKLSTLEHFRLLKVALSCQISSGRAHFW